MNSDRELIKKIRFAAQKQATKALRGKSPTYSRHWIRPPFALEEADFLLACSRCNACVEACAFKVIFCLPRNVGVLAELTPAMDLLNRGCHLCVDWPCVTACHDGALYNPFPVRGPGDLPRLARVGIDESLCITYLGQECAICGMICPVPGAQTWDLGKPVINQEICVGCGLCREVCQGDPKAIHIRFLAA
ncbi:MAG: 4Fe-4S binding protein [Gammaproteobacteria bacterium]|nr:4Fe-4S binding protein [Gammaproteobacteria bacterium]